MVKIVLLALLAVCGWGLASGCSCLFEHDQKAFCGGNNALEFKVIRRRIVRLNSRRIWRYEVSGVKVYQKKNELNNFPIRYIYSEVSSAACGITLQYYKTYAVIGGYVNSGRFWINSCNNIDELSRKSRGAQNFARILLAWLYPAACDRCSICNSKYNNCQGNEKKYCDQKDLKSNNRLETTCFPIFYRCRWYGESGVLP